jgi:hypothetical protein
VIANTSTANVDDGIDFDANANYCTALFNTCNGNKRNGIFVEEGTHDTLSFGNILTANATGINVDNVAVTGNTGTNVLACNICNANGGGEKVMGTSSSITANENLFFNNVTINSTNTSNYGVSVQKFSTNNLFSQCVTTNNVANIQTNSGSADLFFNSVTNVSGKP